MLSKLDWKKLKWMTGILMMALAACSPQTGSEPAAAVATAMPATAVAQVLEPTVEATVEPTAEPTPLPTVPAVVETAVEFVLSLPDGELPIYAGPGGEFEQIGFVAGGMLAKVTGQSADGLWWRVICPDDTVGDCWVSADPALTQPAEAPIVDYGTEGGAAVGAPPPGLMFTQMETQWLYQVTENGIETLVEQPGAMLSPDGTFAVFNAGDGQLTLVDLTTNAVTPVASEFFYIPTIHGWLNNDTVLLGVWRTVDSEGPNAGALALYNLPLDTFTVLDERLSFATAAVAVDNRSIAYDVGGQGHVFDLDRGTGVPFDPTTFEGWTFGPETRLSSPSWSRDGRQIAWIIGGADVLPEWGIATAVFKLDGQAVEVLQPYAPAGMGGWPAAAAFRPDGQWVAVYQMAANPAEGGLWLMAVDGSEARHLGTNASRPVWQPDGGALYFQLHTDQGDLSIQRLDMVGGQEAELDLPAGSMPVGWRVGG